MTDDPNKTPNSGWKFAGQKPLIKLSFVVNTMRVMRKDFSEVFFCCCLFSNVCRCFKIEIFSAASLFFVFFCLRNYLREFLNLPYTFLFFYFVFLLEFKKKKCKLHGWNVVDLTFN